MRPVFIAPLLAVLLLQLVLAPAASSRTPTSQHDPVFTPVPDGDEPFAHVDGFPFHYLTNNFWVSYGMFPGAPRNYQIQICADQACATVLVTATRPAPGTMDVSAITPPGANLKLTTDTPYWWRALLSGVQLSSPQPFRIMPVNSISDPDPEGTPVPTLIGTAGIDHIYGSSADNTIHGGAQQDRLHGDGGNDTIHGGLNDDHIEGGDGNDTIYGDTGNDDVNPEDGNDIVDAGAGDDRISDSAGDDRIDAGPGDDWLGGGTGSKQLIGGDGDDYITDEGARVAVMSGGDGNDGIYADAQGVTVDAGAGRDHVVVAGSVNVLGARITLGPGNDTLGGPSLVDSTVDAGAGDDRVEAGPGTIRLGTGADWFAFGAHAGTKRWSIDLGAGNDHVEYAGLHLGPPTRGSVSTIIAGTGNDVIQHDSSLARTTLYCGPGIDTVIFSRARGRAFNPRLASRACERKRYVWYACVLVSGREYWAPEATRPRGPACS